MIGRDFFLLMKLTAHSKLLGRSNSTLFSLFRTILISLGVKKMNTNKRCTQDCEISYLSPIGIRDSYFRSFCSMEKEAVLALCLYCSDNFKKLSRKSKTGLPK